MKPEKYEDLMIKWIALPVILLGSVLSASSLLYYFLLPITENYALENKFLAVAIWTYVTLILLMSTVFLLIRDYDKLYRRECSRKCCKVKFPRTEEMAEQEQNSSNR